MSLLGLFLGLEAHFVDIILQALCLELQLVVFCLQDTLRGALFFDLFGMFD